MSSKGGNGTVPSKAAHHNGATSRRSAVRRPPSCPDTAPPRQSHVETFGTAFSLCLTKSYGSNFPRKPPRCLPQAPGYLRLPAVRGRRSAVVAGQQRSSLLLPCAPAPTRRSTTPAPGRRRSSRGGRRPRRHMPGGPHRRTRSYTRSRIRSCSHIRTRTRRAAARVGSG